VAIPLHGVTRFLLQLDECGARRAAVDMLSPVRMTPAVA
jgi:hypothetical protein